ncbi:aminotransferase class III-fold pyridoxal phosphate-dependent enzyme [Spartinivicinus marinus]|nr:aminotransferase class III-fold pyridoxal phosphate-dependent enzyme [Spartinivicinus marinus]MCX4025850.1 aminotransferase class III-fold pyridoxal phosphate-dependent enzyme [Spartinivicinus marinus]
MKYQQQPNMNYHWMPFTSNQTFKADPQLFCKTEGVYYWNHRDEKILDGCSGLFCTPAGHGRKEIANAVFQQLQTMDYSPHFMRANPTSFELAEKIANMLPEGINRVFFCSSGSESVDTAIKIAYAYHHANGQPQRQRLVSRERAYHGVNLGGTSLSGMVKNREIFGQGIPGVVHMRHTWLTENQFTIGEGEQGAELADDLLRAVQLHGVETIAACFVEPIAGSTGVLVPPKGYLQRLREICDQYGILLVFDEVITGFGRTGKAFAADSFGVIPDIITMAKALTNGAQPMGAIAVKQSIYDTIVNAGQPGVPEFFHGYTYSCHPASCAASLATLAIYEQEGLFEQAAVLAPLFQEAIFSLSRLPIIKDIRGYGLLAGFDVESDSIPGSRGNDLQLKLFEAGLHIKTTGDAGIVAPAFISTPSHIEQMTDILHKVLSQY